MTPAERGLISTLVVVPGRPYTGDREAVLRHFRSDDGRVLGLDLLRGAIADRSADDLEAALIVCGAFGIDAEHAPMLVDLVYDEWHQQHEVVVSMLGSQRGPAVVDALHHAASWVPRYLDYDESRALAVNAIWALGDMSDPRAGSKLKQLADANNEIVREAATHQLSRRGVLSDGGDGNP
ncbi:HEAT repeat domain-containing protein [Micromonospora tulbaghiae]|uniref:HEAT repeat domain-containing protein n=1 Tax=Micromonospora tulbaghiae TaxID=479978 RepID=UPI0033D44DDA